MAAHEENSWPPTGINLSAYRDLAVAADSGRQSMRSAASSTGPDRLGVCRHAPHGSLAAPTSRQERPQIHVRAYPACHAAQQTVPTHRSSARLRTN